MAVRDGSATLQFWHWGGGGCCCTCSWECWCWWCRCLECVEGVGEGAEEPEEVARNATTVGVDIFESLHQVINRLLPSMYLIRQAVFLHFLCFCVCLLLAPSVRPCASNFQRSDCIDFPLSSLFAWGPFYFGELYTHSQAHMGNEGGREWPLRKQEEGRYGNRPSILNVLSFSVWPFP